MAKKNEYKNKVGTGQTYDEYIGQSANNSKSLSDQMSEYRKQNYTSNGQNRSTNDKTPLSFKAVGDWFYNTANHVANVTTGHGLKYYGNAIGDAAQPVLDLIDDASGSDNPSSSSGRKRGGYGGGSVSVAGSSVNTGNDAYLDMLHAEQERIWNREDTAYQRTVKDLQAAGLNPVLAARGGLSPVGGSSSSSDSQVVGAVADLAGLAIEGLTETAKGVNTLAAISTVDNKEKPSLISKAGSWYKKNAGTIRTAISTASTLARLFK